VFLKGLLQLPFPGNAQSRICSELFTEFVTDDEQGLADRVYMNLSQLKELKSAGMLVGSHTVSHPWLDTLDQNSQRREILESVEYLQENDLMEDEWGAAYPYGAHDDSLLEVMQEAGCSFALTTQAILAIVDPASKFTIARLDTNDLPKSGEVESDRWVDQLRQSNSQSYRAFYFSTT
jgi:peptidoglycan/xylan/chitin deacetylase (PgdA/CDA1 family)